jgi:hypothetical protein
MSGFRTIAAAVALIAALASSEGLAQDCVSRGEGQQMVASGQVSPLPAALQNAGLSGAQVLDAELCRAGGGWAYRVRYRRDGQVEAANIPAN